MESSLRQKFTLEYLHPDRGLGVSYLIALLEQLLRPQITSESFPHDSEGKVYQKCPGCPLAADRNNNISPMRTDGILEVLLNEQGYATRTVDRQGHHDIHRLPMKPRVP